MANFNKVILAGNLTRDPQLSYLPSNTPVVEFGMAINRKWKSQDGQQKEDVCFVDIRAFGRQAETLNQYMKKGNPLLVEGRLRYEQWEAKEGGKRSRLSVVVENFQFLPTGDRQGGGDRSQGAGRSYGGGRSPAPSTAAAPSGSGDYEMPPMQEEAPSESGENVPF